MVLAINYYFFVHTTQDMGFFTQNILLPQSGKKNENSAI